MLIAAAALALLAAAPDAAKEPPKGPAGYQMPKEAPGKPDPARVAAATYKVDPEHTLVVFTVDHMGFNNYFGIFGGATGELQLDPKRLSAAKVNVTIPLARLTVANDALKTHMSSPDFFEVAKFPTASFASTSVTPTGKTTARIAGVLTLKGKATPVTLQARFTGAGAGPMPPHAQNIGFEATASVSRTALGIPYGVPLVSDKVDLKITAAFEKPA